MSHRTEKTCHLVRPARDGDFPVELEAHVSGVIEKHFGRLEVRDFQSDLILTESERETCESELIDRAQTMAGFFGSFPEQEPDARRYSP